MAARRFLRRVRLPVPAAEAFAWHERPGAFERLNPPWDPVNIVRRAGGIRDGARITLLVGPPPFTLRWSLEHRAYREGEQFMDVQVRGPFARWEHTHRFRADGPAGAASVLEDDLTWQVPLGKLGELLAGAAVEAMLDRLFRYRHRVTAGDLAAHAPHAGLPRLTVLLGATDDAAEPGRPSPASSCRGETLLQHLAAYLGTAGHGVWRSPTREPLRAAPGPAHPHRHLPGPIPAVSADVPASAPPDPPGRFGARIGWQGNGVLTIEVGSRTARILGGVVLLPGCGPLRRPRLPWTGRTARSRLQGMPWIALDDWLGLVGQVLHDDSLAGDLDLGAGGASPWRRRWPDLEPALDHLLGRG